MFFFISKILAFLITPMFWIMGLLLWAILTKNQIRKKRLMIISFSLAWLLSNPFILNEVLLKWEGPIAKSTEITESYDIGIVLGGFSSFDTISNRFQLEESGDRLWQALYLYKTGEIKKILISGGSGSILHKKITEADKARDVLLKMGFPSEDLLVETKSRNTRENAAESAKIINVANPNARCLLITSAFHMKRSLGCYKKVHLDVTPYKADYMSKTRVWDPDVLLLPKPESLFGWNKLIREIVGYYAYKIAGYI